MISNHFDECHFQNFVLSFDIIWCNFNGHLQNHFLEIVVQIAHYIKRINVSFALAVLIIDYLLQKSIFDLNGSLIKSSNDKRTFQAFFSWYKSIKTCVNNYFLCKQSRKTCFLSGSDVN